MCHDFMAAELPLPTLPRFIDLKLICTLHWSHNFQWGSSALEKQRCQSVWQIWVASFLLIRSPAEVCMFQAQHILQTRKGSKGSWTQLLAATLSWWQYGSHSKGTSAEQWLTDYATMVLKCLPLESCHDSMMPVNMRSVTVTVQLMVTGLVPGSPTLTKPGRGENWMPRQA
jgi:hypothetical protein